jgi:hypothetical protein
MKIEEFLALQTQVLWVSFVVCVFFGALARRTDFCTMGAISDIYNIRSWVRMRMWGMAVGVAMIGFYLMAWLGWIDPTQTIYSSGRIIWLSAIVGGLMFGFGMVLASGCASKTLVRIGEGSLKSLVVFFVLGLSAFATMRGMTAMLRSKTIDQVVFNIDTGSAAPSWLSAVLGTNPGTTGLVFALLIGGGLIAWAMFNRKFISSANNLLAGLGIGMLIATMWWIIGHMGFVAEDPQTLDVTYLGTAGGKMQALSFTSPIARTIDYVISFDNSTTLTLGVVAVIGVILGSFAYSLYSRTFQWEGFHGTQDTALHIIGATFMGIGGVTAGGCTVGNGLSGLSTLSITSMIAVVGIMLGAIIGLRLQRWLIMRD